MNASTQLIGSTIAMALADDKMRRTITIPDDLDRLVSDLAEKSVRPISSQYEYLVRMALAIPEIAEQAKSLREEPKS